MIQDYFRLQREPFASVPTPDQYFPASSIESARTSLVRLVERDEGPALVIGPVGTGKTLLCQLLAESFRHRCRVVILPSGRLSSRRNLLQVILFELGLPYRDLDEGELRLSLIDHVTNRDVCPKGILLQVDEGESLSLPLLDELRSLTNLTNENRSCIRVVIFGTPRLEEKFTHPRLESLNQRLAGRFYLEPFTLEETSSFIQQAFEECGGDPQEAFTDEALCKIHRACGGIPRLVNQLADHALLLAVNSSHEVVDSSCVEEAWADLQQLPMPSDARFVDSSRSLPADIVEFGELDDDSHDEQVSAEHIPQHESFDMDTPAEEDAIHAVEEGSSELFVSEELDHDGEPFESSEVTLVFHSTNDPFGDDFEEEEIVIDHFISPDALAQRHRRQVQTEASEILARQIFKLRQNSSLEIEEARDTAIETVATAELSRPPEQVSDAPDAARNPAWTTERTDVSQPFQLSALDFESQLPTDDTETEACGIIPIDDHHEPAPGSNDETVSVDQTSTSQIVRQDTATNSAGSPNNFSRLFSQLRRRHG